jgi:hypothetical protein
MKIRPVIRIELDQVIEVRESLIEPVCINRDQSAYGTINQIVGPNSIALSRSLQAFSRSPNEARA